MSKEGLVGATNTKEWLVTKELLSSTVTPGTPAVFSTPNMLLMVEQCCFELMGKFADEGEASCGADIHMKHSSPTPEGMKVFCEVKCIEEHKGLYNFEFEVKDEAGVIGSGTHMRAYAPAAVLEKKAAKKFNK